MLYRVRTFYAKKVWIRPRLRQLAEIAWCYLSGGHQWGRFTTDDYIGDEPIGLRECLPGEAGLRACKRHCGALQARQPASAGDRVHGRLQSRGD